MACHNKPLVQQQQRMCHQITPKNFFFVPVDRFPSSSEASWEIACHRSTQGVSGLCPKQLKSKFANRNLPMMTTQIIPTSIKLTG